MRVCIALLLFAAVSLCGCVYSTKGAPVPWAKIRDLVSGVTDQNYVLLRWGEPTSRDWDSLTGIETWTYSRTKESTACYPLLVTYWVRRRECTETIRLHWKGGIYAGVAGSEGKTGEK